MEERFPYHSEEATIDLVQLFFFVLKKWKAILALLLVGILLGAGYSFTRKEKTLEDLEMNKLHLEQIVQYHDYQLLYQQHLAAEKTSLIQQMDPNNVYSRSRTFLLNMRLEDYQLISQRFSTLLEDNERLQKLIEASGLDCDERSIRQLVNVWVSKISDATLWDYLGTAPGHAKLHLSVKAPTEESSNILMDMLSAFVDELQMELSALYPGYAYDSLTDYCTFGYDSGIHDQQLNSASTLQSYVKTIVDLEKTLTEDDLFYYSEVFASETDKEEESSIMPHIKWAVIGGVLLCFIAVAGYAVLFLIDGHVKTLSELREEFGLFTMAYLNNPQQKEKDFVARLVDRDELPVNSCEYLLEALDSIGMEGTLLCGDQSNALIAETMNWLREQNDSLVAHAKLTDCSDTLSAAKSAAGVVLFIQLWKTTKNDLIRELEIANRMHLPVKGLVVFKA